MIKILIKITNKISDIILQEWNLAKLRSFSSQIEISDNGKSYRLIGHFYIRMKKNAKMTIGKNLTINSGIGYNPISRNIRAFLFAGENAIITIGDNVGISGSCVWAHESITIGNNVNIGADSILIDSDCHSLDCVIRRSKEDQHRKQNKPIIIEDDVLIGARSIILKDVTIGSRSVIGAGSVVTKSVPPDEIWAGNPAVFIKKLNYT